MKIFNWVHKRFHQRALNDGFAENVKKSELETKDKDTQAFLTQVGLVNVDGLDSWKDGILTIGTFGFESFDPVKPFNCQNEYLILDNEEDKNERHEFSHSGNDDDNDDDDDDEHYDHNVEDEELNPLMFTTFGHSFEDIGSNSGAIAEKSADNVILTVDGVPLTPFHEGSNEIDEDLKNKKGQRITLADLFLADVHDAGQLKLDSNCKVQPDQMQKKMDARTRSGLAFAKKFIPRVKEDSSPIKNLQRMMKRMLKRKIHPAELDAKIHKSDDQKQLSEIELITNVGNDASESVSLLPTQGVTCVH